MEKQLGWPHELGGGVEPLWISKVGHIMLARLMESQIWHQLAGSVGRRFRKGTMDFAYFDDRHFSFSLYATGAFQATNLVVELRWSEYE